MVVLISYHCYPVNTDKVCKVVAEQVPFLSVKSNLLTDSGIVADSSQGVNKVEYWFSVIIKDYERCVIEVKVANEILMYFRNQKKHQNDVNISDPIETDGDGNALTFMDVVYEDEHFAEDLDLKINSKKLYKLLDQIPEREREILIMRYGLYDSMPLTQKKVAEELGISRSYVSRIETKAIDRLKDLYQN